MSDVRNALSALCGFINSLINVDLTPEHLRLAKFNAPDGNVAETLKDTLHILSYRAAREKRDDIDFRNYDTLTAVKLHLAFLEYPAIEFYSVSQSSKDRNRDLLIALAWLLGTQDALNVTLRTKLTGSVLGVECSRVDPLEESATQSLAAIARLDDNEPTIVQLAGLLHLNARVNLNLREIDELTRERANLVSKVHVASVDVSGLPHLSVSDSALTKRLATTNDDRNSDDAEDLQRKYRDAGILLDARTRWLRKRHVFFDWMVTVIQEHRKSSKTSPKEIDLRELVAFSTLLRRVIRERLRVLASANNGESRYATLDCPSRGFRSQCKDDVEARNWLDDLNVRQKCEEEDLQRNRKRLAEELEGMLKLIPSIVRV